MSMTDRESRVIVTLGLMAAFADGDKHAHEREQMVLSMVRRG